MIWFLEASERQEELNTIQETPAAVNKKIKGPQNFNDVVF